MTTEKESRRFVRAHFKEAVALIASVFAKGEKSEDAFVRDLFKETDRGCVLVATAHIDKALESLLRSFFLRASDIPKRRVESLFDFKSHPLPLLGSLGAKATMAHAIGLLHKSIVAPLGRIREVRNAFAHHPGRVSIHSFTLPPVVRLFDDSDQPRPVIESLAKLAGVVRAPRLSKARVHFMLTAAIVHGVVRATEDAVLRGDWDYAHSSE